MSDPVWNVMLASCPSRTSLARVANKWTAMIVIALSDGPARFGAIRDRVGGISGKVLADTLRDLERDGLLTRTAYDEMPPRVEYELTLLGLTLREPLTALGRWAEHHIEEVLVARDAYDQRSADPVTS
ncbi:winged helix-turn-helix transcriptional regulator [Microbacterium murale]|uniref:DNA-binding HxlR family transcriptional regulator n=1 Tax=Microbacterium murale TaxID=1081040 RepID=A0ABU0P623_9MICO|nr:helix-turn-helix domain-containing protein [Microbacterium murale]MDQ0642773.1 DNA-binding HxlR family transcriptional regulator [Microbacterium murale]